MPWYWQTYIIFLCKWCKNFVSVLLKIHICIYHVDKRPKISNEFHCFYIIMPKLMLKCNTLLYLKPKCGILTHINRINGIKYTNYTLESLVYSSAEGVKQKFFCQSLRQKDRAISLVFLRKPNCKIGFFIFKKLFAQA